jgi:hypothetical protein
MALPCIRVRSPRGVTRENTPSFDGVFSLVNYLTSNWNDILEELHNWSYLIKHVTVANYIPAASGTV